jgi:hypothetical protein
METDRDHGRIKTRSCSILHAKDFLMDENLMSWKDITTLIKIEATREIRGILTRDTRYYISDESIRNAAYYCSLARGALDHRK